MDKNIFEEREQALENEYFRRKNQELIAQMKERLAAEGKTASTLKCPKCTGTLQTGNFENVQVEICDNCHGVWFDAGEVQQIMNKEQGGWFGRLFS